MMNEKEPRYRGDIVDCTRHGKGIYKYPLGGQDMISFSGPWKYGIKEGANGQFIIKGLSIFTGDFKGGEITGKGTKSWEDGRYYEGEWKDGEMNGKGYWINKRTNEIYEGYFLDNKRHGFGTLQKGSESYKGYFKFHKYHGKGTLLRSHQFLISGLFEDGFATGRSTIDWMKTATMDCDWEKGSPSGFGYYSTKDRSYDFEGNFELSLPKLSEVASISWATLDRTDVEAENAGRDAANAVKKKDKKPAAGGGKKGKNDKPTIEPQFSMQRGEAFGKVEIRFASSTHTDLIETAIQSLRSAYAAAKEAKPKLPPYDPSEEEKVKKQPPQLFAVPNERTRRISLRIRPFSVSVDTSHPPATDGSQASLTRTYSEPIDLWIRDLSLVESSNEKTRFSPKSIVIMAEDEKTLSWKDAFAALPSSFSPPPPVVFKRIIPSNVGNALIEDAAASDSVLTVSATSNGFPGFELNSYLLSGGQAASVRIDESRFDGSNQNIAFVIDFSLDSAKCAELRPSPIARSSKRSRSGGETFEIVVASFKKERLSLSVGRENCSLELVLIVPSANATASASQQGGDGSVSRQSAAGPSRPLTGAAADTARSGQGELTSGSPFDSLPIWKGCIWELRRVSSSGSVGSYASEPGSPDIRSIAESKADSSPFANGGSNGDIDGPVQSKAAEKRTICASWSAEDSFLPDYWHSVALILSSSSNTAEGESVAPQVEGNEEDPATPLPLPVPVEYKVDLLVDGAGRMRVERPTKNRRRKSPPRGVEANNSLSSSSGLFDPSIDSSASNGVQNPIEEFMNFFKSAGQEDADQDAETEPPSVEVSVGSSGFAGSLRSLVICGGKDRIDFANATSCYSNWRYDRSLSVESGAESELVASAPPAGYRVAKEVDLHLFCGTAQVTWDRIRIPTSLQPAAIPSGDGLPQLYALEILDNVNEDCTIEQNQLGGLETKRDIAEIVKMVRKVPTFEGIVFSIDINDS